MSFDPITAGIDLVKEGIKRIFPEKMSEEQERKLDSVLEQSFRKFIVEYEGSARDYQHVPIVGPIVLLFRGLIRPLWTIGTLYWNWVYFTSVDQWPEMKWRLLLINTILVLVFWFGERAVKNVTPFLVELFKKR